MITLGYGHADKIAGHVAGTPAAGNTPPIDPALYRREDVRRVLADRDITALYRILRDTRITQRRIAELTGQSQSEVSEIIKGRRVLAYDLLVRIAQGLGIPRELMGLGYGERGAYGGGVTVARSPDGVDEAATPRSARRRHPRHAGVRAVVRRVAGPLRAPGRGSVATAIRPLPRWPLVLPTMCGRSPRSPHCSTCSN